MSLAGALIFERNLRKMMATEAFKKADEGERLKIGGRLLQSKYGGVMGTKVQEIPAPPPPPPPRVYKDCFGWLVRVKT